MKSSTKMRAAVEFKGLGVPALRAVLRDASPQALHDAIEALRTQQPEFFDWQPVVIDVSRLPGAVEQFDWAGLVTVFRGARLHPVAIAGAPESFRAAADALQLGLTDLPPGSIAVQATPGAAQPAPRSATPEAPTADAVGEQPVEPTPSGPVSDEPVVAAPEPVPAPGPAPASATAAAAEAVAASAPVAGRAETSAEGPAPVPPSAPPIPSDALVIDRPVRSGQQVYARGRDLVITAMVSPGAEVVADGNVHLYGPMAGRAIAGARGNRDARIFALDLRAELVAVAGLYKTFEDGIPDALRNRPVQILLEPRASGPDGEGGGSLVIRPF